LNPYFFALFNFIVLAVFLIVVLRKGLTTFFKRQREELEQKMNEASVQHEKMRAEFEVAKTQMKDVESKIHDMRLAAKREIEFESKRIEVEADGMATKLLRDCEVKIKAETDRARSTLQKELLEMSLKTARAELAKELKNKDESWTNQMLQTESQSLRAAGSK